MERFDPERVVTTHYEQYLDEPNEWLGVKAVGQIVTMIREQVPDAELVIITFDDNDMDGRGDGMTKGGRMNPAQPAVYLAHPTHKDKLEQILIAKLDEDVSVNIAKQQIIDLMLEIVGEDETLFSPEKNASMVVENNKRKTRNKLGIEQRKAIEALKGGGK